MRSRCSVSRSCSACAARSIWRRPRSSASAPMPSGSAPPTTRSATGSALSAGCLMALVAGAVLGMSTLRLGGHYLAMVTISFQQIVTLVMINAIWLTHGPDGVSRIGRPALFQSAQAYLAFCVAVLAIVGYVVWHLPDTRLGRAMRAVRDNELAAGVIGVDVFRTKVSAFALCAVLGGLAGGLFAGGFAYVSPDQFSFAESVVFLTMSLARRRGVADRLGDRHGSADPDPGMAAVPQERSRAVSRDLWPVRHPDHPLHAGRHLGIRRQRHRALARARSKAPPAAAALQLKPATRRRRHRARSHRAVEAFRRPQGG